MNNLFIGLYEREDKDSLKKILNDKLEYYKYNFLKYNYNSSILDNNVKNMNLIIDSDYIFNSILENKKFSLKTFCLKHDVTKEILGITNINIIFDKKFDELDENKKKLLREYVYKVLMINEKIKINEVKIESMMHENDVKYIEEYIVSSNLNRNKLKILVILNDISDYCEEKLKQYISSYKFVDILKMSNINKIELGKLQESINSINEEYGSTIEIISKKNIQEYNIYMMYSNVSYDYFTSHYILKKKSKYIDMNNEDLDLYNNNVLEFEKNKSYILEFAKKLNIDITKYSKCKIGNVINVK